MPTLTTNGPLQISRTTTHKTVNWKTIQKRDGRQLGTDESSQWYHANHDLSPWVPQMAHKPDSQMHGPAQTTSQPKALDPMLTPTNPLTDPTPHHE